MNETERTRTTPARIPTHPHSSSTTEDLEAQDDKICPSAAGQAISHEPQLTPQPANILALQQTIGNRAVQRLIQRKLLVGGAHDPSAQEAERVAEQVQPLSLAVSSSRLVQRGTDGETGTAPAAASAVAPTASAPSTVLDITHTEEAMSKDRIGMHSFGVLVRIENYNPRTMTVRRIANCVKWETNSKKISATNPEGKVYKATNGTGQVSGRGDKGAPTSVTIGYSDSQPTEPAPADSEDGPSNSSCKMEGHTLLVTDHIGVCASGEGLFAGSGRQPPGQWKGYFIVQVSAPNAGGTMEVIARHRMDFDKSVPPPLKRLLTLPTTTEPETETTSVAGADER